MEVDLAADVRKGLMLPSIGLISRHHHPQKDNMAFGSGLRLTYHYLLRKLTYDRGAYCASVIISLLNIPQELAPESPARAGGHTRLFDGLAQWISRCKYCRS